MLAMWTTKSVPQSFTYRNCNTSEQGAKKIIQRKLSYSVFLRQKILQARNWQSNQSWFKDSRHQSLIVNWLIKVRRFWTITIWCEMKVGWNEHGVNERGAKWTWGEMNVGWNECGVKWSWGEMNVGWNDMGWNDMEWNDFGVKWFWGKMNGHREKWLPFHFQGWKNVTIFVLTSILCFDT